MNPVKIETLMIRNFKRVDIAEVEFSGDGVNIIGGKNRAGKSSFLDAIKFLLGGKKYSSSNPHNENADGATAVVRTTLNNGIQVERSGKSSTLKISVDDRKGNQGTLNEFLNEFALDINKFMRSSEAEKTKMLIKHLGIGEALDELDERIKKIFEERTLINREVDKKKKLAETAQTHDDAPESRVSVSQLVEELREKESQNKEHELRISEMDALKAEGIRKQEEIKKLQAEIAELKEQYTAKKQVADQFTPHEVDPIRERIDSAESLNKMFDDNEKAEAIKREAKDAQKEAQGMTDALEEARQQRTKLLEDMKMPLEGLTIEDGDLIYKGQRWDNMSGAERMIVATAISRAFKPECGFVLIDELEQMDWDTIKNFDEWCVGQSIQVIGAMVCDEDKGGERVIIINDGKVKESD